MIQLLYEKFCYIHINRLFKKSVQTIALLLLRNVHLLFIVSWYLAGEHHNVNMWISFKWQLIIISYLQQPHSQFSYALIWLWDIIYFDYSHFKQTITIIDKLNIFIILSRLKRLEVADVYSVRSIIHLV